ncbi:acid phosphatase AphA [Enterobacillus tribolii]|uniref:Class B acid phosphatase n=1 Tax=Enterobacillus tribolii TaxID=1487935 RepID=A0A370R251_9GAMM|nr:acid phosphatase AphA [Enterobacillus tribolii]MBW7984801.1 class B acid phosphatase [Enterobacillus tribolii]RDK95992.1 acid phosphatase (class B) [Enterobacillus tribolii]
MYKYKMARSAALISALIFTAPAFCANPTSPVASIGATLQQMTKQYPIHLISIEQIAEELKNKPPMDIGFDIDDTIYYSTPAFIHGQRALSPESNDFLKKSEFWDQLSNGWDSFSVPKKSASALIKLHMDRGDRIWFITGRPKPTSGKETVTELLGKDFSIPQEKLNKVIFAGEDKGAKIQYIRDRNIKYYYGDSDGDIKDAREAGAEPIRVMRALNSSNQPMPRNGSLGEKVLINSDY